MVNDGGVVMVGSVGEMEEGEKGKKEKGNEVMMWH